MAKGRVRPARWFVVRALDDGSDMEVRGFGGYTEALDFFRKAVLLSRAEDPGVAPYVELLDHERTVVFQAEQVFQRSEWTKVVLSGAARFRWDPDEVPLCEVPRLVTRLPVVSPGQPSITNVTA